MNAAPLSTINNKPIGHKGGLQSSPVIPPTTHTISLSHIRARAQTHALEVGVDGRVAAGSQDGIIMRVCRALMQLPLLDPDWTRGTGWV